MELKHVATFGNLKIVCPPLELPFPNRTLLPNRNLGRHWAVRHKAKVDARDSAYLLALSWRRKHNPQCRGRLALLIEWRFNGSRPDLDNLLAATKPMLDGLARALGVDDGEIDPLLITRSRIAKSERTSTFFYLLDHENQT